MGLDMYLTAKRKFFKAWKQTEESTTDEKLRLEIRRLVGVENFETSNLETTTIGIEAAYWRKANAIHSWFVHEIQDDEDNCQEYFVTREQLDSLRDVCARTLIERTKEAAKANLHPAEGFFFGSTEIDSWYWEQLAYTVDQISKILTAFDTSWEFYYRASW